tara:strand:- start:270 stop:1241 length:972 start_codon:yes stop_codon:yes gene_type:complete
VIDNCNECILEGEISSCIQGCDGNWNNIGFIKEYDECGVCGGDNTSCTDCAGNINGNFWSNTCGICVTIGDTSCALDCANIPNGNSFLDNCNNCVDGTSIMEPCKIDCNGEWGGTAKIDQNCGTCIEGETDLSACTQDCNSVWGGSFTEDICGVCDGNTDNNNQCLDCNGIIDGLGYLDNCGNCIENLSDSSYECILDCSGVWGGNYLPSYICPNEVLVCSPSYCELSFNDDYIIPNEFNIEKIFPNPFNPQATINYTISEQSIVQLNIYNIQGKKIEELKNELINPGFYSVVWNGKNYSSGIYFVVLNNNKSIITRKVMLLK